jgi:hypothetical protein
MSELMPYAAKGGNIGAFQSTQNETSEHMNKERIGGIQEVSNLTGLSEYAIRAGIKEGIFPAFRIKGCGSKYFINIDMFQAAVRELSNRNMKQHGDDDAADNGGIRRIKA